MKNLITLALCFVSLNCFSQDTTCTMIRLDEIIHFDYYTNEIITRQETSGDITLNINGESILCLHLFDDKNMQRTLSVRYTNGDYLSDTVKSKDIVLFSTDSVETVEISKPFKCH